MSENSFERDDARPDDEIGSPEDELGEDRLDVLLEQGYSPPDRPHGVLAYGTTLTEEREGESLDERLRQEEPDPALAVDPIGGARDDAPGDDDEVDDTLDDGEVGDARAGRLVDLDDGGYEDTEKDLLGADVGLDGGAASAEEAAMHIVDLDAADAELSWHDGARSSAD